MTAFTEAHRWEIDRLLGRLDAEGQHFPLVQALEAALAKIDRLTAEVEHWRREYKTLETHIQETAIVQRDALRALAKKALEAHAALQAAIADNPEPWGFAMNEMTEAQNDALNDLFRTIA